MEDDDLVNKEGKHWRAGTTIRAKPFWGMRGPRGFQYKRGEREQAHLFSPDHGFDTSSAPPKHSACAQERFAQPKHSCTVSDMVETSFGHRASDLFERVDDAVMVMCLPRRWLNLQTAISKSQRAAIDNIACLVSLSSISIASECRPFHRKYIPPHIFSCVESSTVYMSRSKQAPSARQGKGPPILLLQISTTRFRASQLRQRLAWKPYRNRSNQTRCNFHP